MKEQQRDFIIELEDAKKVDSVAMQEFVNNLPPATMLSPGDIASALNLQEETVRGYIEAGEIRAFKTPMEGRTLYKIPRVEALAFFKRNFS